MPTDFVTIVNQTDRLLTLNLAPVSDNGIHLPPRGRVSILEEELEAVEIRGAIRATPARLVVLRPKKVAVPEPQTIASKPAPPQNTSESQVQVREAPVIPSSTDEESTEPRTSHRRQRSNKSSF